MPNSGTSATHQLELHHAHLRDDRPLSGGQGIKLTRGHIVLAPEVEQQIDLRVCLIV